MIRHCNRISNTHTLTFSLSHTPPRLLVNLTQPAYLCFGSSFPKAKESDAMKCFMEVESYLRHYKEVSPAPHSKGSCRHSSCQWGAVLHV